MRRLLLPTLAAAMAMTYAEARPRTCTNAELDRGLTDNMVIQCTGKGGSVKCDPDGTVLCCKKLEGGGQMCVDEKSLNLLRNTPSPPTKPPKAGGGDKPPGKINP